MKSKIFFFLFFASILAIVLGLVATIEESFWNSYLILMGIGLLLLAYYFTKSKGKRLKILLSGGYISFSCAFFLYTFFCFQADKIITAIVFGLLGLLTFGFFIYSLLKGDESH
jgi:hypothetical protein